MEGSGPQEVAGVFSNRANTLENMKDSFFECENASLPQCLSCAKKRLEPESIAGAYVPGASLFL